MSDARMDLCGSRVRRLGFGTLRLLGPAAFGQPPSRTDAERLLAAAANHSDVIDTADCYGPETAENLIASVLHPYRHGLVVATKGGLTCPAPGVWIPSAAPDRLRRCCEDSLRRLRTDRIDLYQLHGPDPMVTYEHSIEALARLRAEGLIMDVGLCNVSADQLRRAQRIVPISSVQNRYNVGYRADDSLVALAASEGLPFLAWFPLERGSLAAGAAASLTMVAEKHGASRAQIALAWLLHRSGNLVPIPGTGSVRHLEENAGAVSVDLDPEDMRALEGITV
ncbi:aldo/keto reductase [Amycolatopsis sp. Hca4]|uniref:aldo/keto reductase n=1 Tax=Amycolatopsis sp. Hca4 TaxID=2742131 RepID=UPI0015916491|nr:aldo/keto reductase [Amycolatopsis sp. Hca4]QKV80634.1 aldo/keto reductase [Amycolatopsis sp. Hca4]